MALPFLDTNIILRHLLQDHADHSPRATAYLGRVERREVRVRTSDAVVLEAVFTLQRHYGRGKAEIRDALLPLLELPGIVLPGKGRLPRIFELYIELNLPFADAYHAALIEHLRLEEIVSFDRDFDRVEGLRRIEP